MTKNTLIKIIKSDLGDRVHMDSFKLSKLAALGREHDGKSMTPQNISSIIDTLQLIFTNDLITDRRVWEDIKTHLFRH